MREEKKCLWLLLFMMFMMAIPSTDIRAAVCLSKTSVTLQTGSREKIKLTGTTEKITWSSLDKKVAKIAADGTITAVKTGNTWIKGKVGTRTYKCMVRVVALNKNRITLKQKGSASKLKVINGENITWKSSNTSVVKVKSSGKIIAKKSGTAVIYATCDKVTMTCKVYVPKKNHAYLCMDKENDKNKKIYFTVSCCSGSPKYSSSNTSVCSINSKTGRCTMHKTGTAVLTAKVNGFEYTCPVMVGIYTPLSWISSSNKVAKKKQKIYVGSGQTRTYSVYAQSYDDNAFKKNIKITSGKTTTTYYVKKYVAYHGCAVCATTAVLSGYASYTGRPSSVVKNVERKVFGLTKWKKNYKKGVYSQMPVSQYGISRILKSYGIKNTYVRSFKNRNAALNQIKTNLLKGKPVVIIVDKENQVTGATTHRWATTKHTMVLLGMTKTNKVIIADSAERSSSFNNMGRIKTAYLSDVGAYMLSVTAKKGSDLTSPYYSQSKYCGGYILVK